LADVEEGSSEPTGWTPIRRPRAHELVVEAIEHRILEGKLSAGDRLPPERTLADALGVSRASVREAFRILESMGVIRATVGSGDRSGSFLVSMPSEPLSRLLSIHLALSSFAVRDVMETRIVLEVAAAQAASTRASPTQLSHLRSLVTSMADPEVGPAGFDELDTALHVGIAEASGNPLLSDLMHALRDAVRREMTSAFAQIPDWPTAVGRLVAEHTSLLHAIEAGNGDEAGRLVRAHIEDFYEINFPS
jgi:GntR family transcriptional regulator, transcriptional repressor for pyruvate dehydrogenase complex